MVPQLLEDRQQICQPSAEIDLGQRDHLINFQHYLKIVYLYLLEIHWHNEKTHSFFSLNLHTAVFLSASYLKKM